MVSALGWSSDVFDPAEPGRLCRGRERWIESYDLDDEVELFRVVVSGARFSDDSARDAERGLDRSGVSMEHVFDALFGGMPVLAWCEEGHPLQVPEGAVAVEEYDLRRAGGSLHRWTVRWTLHCTSPEDIQRALQHGAEVLTVHNDDSLPVDDDGVPSKELRDAVFLLSGSRHPGPPARNFQPVALPEVLEMADAVVLIHKDKHAPCLGVYTVHELDPGDVLDEVLEDTDIMVVPFAIPPMLARWDRALWELRQDWDEDMQGEFPVPPAPEGSWGWGRRQRSRSRGRGEE